MINGSYSIGRSGLLASQVGMNVTGNNISNASTPGFSRQRLDLAASGDQPFGRLRLGRGVDVQGIRRLSDDALQQRLLASTSADAAASTNSGVLGDMEAIIGTLDAQGRTDLGRQLNSFFDAWSDIASSSNSVAARTNVVNQGTTLANYLRSMRAQVSGQAGAIETQLSAAASSTDLLLREVARLNGQIVSAGGAASAGLQDQRDQTLAQLSNLVDITTAPQDNGAVNVFIGSTPMVVAGIARGVKLDIRTENGVQTVSLATTDNNEVLDVTSGRVGALLEQRARGVGDVLSRIDRLTGELIEQVNRVYTEGAPLTNVRTLTGATRVTALDRPLSLNDPANTAFAGLTHPPTSGAITLRIRNDATGSYSDVAILIDLDGLTSTSAAGFADDTSFDDIVTALNAVPNLSASVTPEGQLRVTTASGFSVSVTDDTSGVLSTLGVNTYFTGSDASNIAVRSDLLSDPSTLAVRTTNKDGVAVDNGVGLAIVELRTKAIDRLGGNSLLGDWSGAVQELGVKTAAANTTSETSRAIKENLESQKAAISGVSLDEEAINLVLYQTQYQASARYISVLQEMTQTLLQMT